MYIQVRHHEREFTTRRMKILQDLRKFTVKPPFVGAIHESPLLYMVSMRKSCPSSPIPRSLFPIFKTAAMCYRSQRKNEKFPLLNSDS